MNTPGLLAGTLLLFVSALAGTFARDGASFDTLSAADRSVFQERFTKDVWPAFERGGKKGCLGCHGPGGKGGGSLRMKGDPAKDFLLLLKEGFFLPDDSGSVLTRVTSKDRKQMMPPPGKGGEHWTKTDVEVLQKFVLDLDKKQQKK